MGPGETSVLGASDNGMQAVAEFVEQRFYILVCEQRRFVRSWRREIAKQRDGGPLVFAIGQEFAADNVELREVVEFSFAREHVEVKHAERLATGGIGDQINVAVSDQYVGREHVAKFH